MGLLLFGGHFLLPGVKLARVRSVRVESESPVPYQLDGDFVGYTPFEVELEPGALPVLVARPGGNDGH
jgi:diacylglycerol kinase family enzyme